MKTVELTGALLDYWTARAERVPVGELYFYYTPYTEEKVCARASITATRAVHYSTDWAQGGPLIDKYEIDLTYSEQHPGQRIAWNGPTHAFGNTPLQAICRAVVRAAFGDEVEEVAG